MPGKRDQDAPGSRLSVSHVRIEWNPIAHGGEFFQVRENRRKEKHNVVVPGRDIIASTAQELRRSLWSLVEEGIQWIVVDLTGVRMIDSIGLGVLIAAHNALKRKGGRLCVVNASRDLFSLFSARRLDQHFEVKMTA
jgi:anti-sigma B factor antagonist